ncbi:MAG: sensor histidine kinase [Ignavibacteria bacterium]|nr:sensor histidine kinase [Ignavibacteria bacterium]
MIRSYLNKAGTFTKLLFGLFLIVAVALTDFYTTKDVSFSIFYLIPITFITWNTSKYFGIAFSLICAFIWFYFDTNSLSEITNYALHFWSTIVRFGFFIIVTILISKLKILKDNQENVIIQRTSELLNEISEHEKSKAELLQKSSQLRELYKKIETIKEDQNVQIAREIHDELGQSLTAINLEVNWVSKKHSDNPDVVERMYEISKIVENTIGTVRKISSDLRPRLLDQLGILPAIESLLKDFKNRTKIETELNMPEATAKLDSTGSITVYRICQEALTNIARHSKCTIVYTDINIERNFLILKIRDNGKGFNLKNKLNETKTLGLISMQERAEMINGSLEIKTTENHGTEIKLMVPIN